MHVRVLAAVFLLLGPVGSAVAPEHPGAVAEAILDQLVGCHEIILGAVDIGRCRTCVREEDEGVPVRRSGPVERLAIAVDDQVIAVPVVSAVRLPEKRKPVFGSVETPLWAVGDRADREVRDRPTRRHEVSPVVGVRVARHRVQQLEAALCECVRILHPERRE